MENILGYEYRIRQNLEKFCTQSTHLCFFFFFLNVFLKLKATKINLVLNIGLDKTLRNFMLDLRNKLRINNACNSRFLSFAIPILFKKNKNKTLLVRIFIHWGKLKYNEIFAEAPLMRENQWRICILGRMLVDLGFVKLKFVGVLEIIEGMQWEGEWCKMRREIVSRSNVPNLWF